MDDPGIPSAHGEVPSFLNHGNADGNKFPLLTRPVFFSGWAISITWKGDAETGTLKNLEERRRFEESLEMQRRDPRIRF